MSLYPYQQEVKRLLQSGKSVILQAPTGAGKTRAALAPFIEAFFDLPETAFPQQCLYSVPMRVLANQFLREYEQRVKSYHRVYRPQKALTLSIQTGEFPDDPKFESDLVFTTVDQTLSSLLGVPYSLSQSQANLNAGAVLGSYLVFDEFHLFPQEAIETLLQLLKALSPLTPFLLMTATFSTAMLYELGNWLGAEIVRLSEEEVYAIETAGGRLPRKARRYHLRDKVLNAEDIQGVNASRTLAVCNTVKRASQLYEALLQLGYQPLPFHRISDEIYEELRGAKSHEERRKFSEQAVKILLENLLNAPETPWVMLLHSRFERPHRLVKEELLQTLWGKEGIQKFPQPRLTVVATQVVEVGLDISAEALYTEVAPASSVFQRAGRCARYAGEQGEVYIYQVPLNKKGEPDYSPYLTKAEREIIARSWDSFSRRDAQVLHFDQEQSVIDETHMEADRANLRHMQENAANVWSLITAAMAYGDVSVRAELIRRNLSSRTVIVYDAPPPSQPIDVNPYRYEGFSLHIGSLKGELEALYRLRDEIGLDWALRYPVPIKDEEESRTPVTYRWLDVESEDDLSQSLLFAIHPRLVAYDVERGFRLGIAGNGYTSPTQPSRFRSEYEGYQLESYQEHIGNMVKVFERGPWQRRLRWASNRLETHPDERWRLPAGALERAVRLSFILHDLGKLDVRWQKWAATYQELLTGQRPVFLIAHTEWDSKNPLHREVQQKAGRKCAKPKTHAGEGAEAAARILWEALGKAHRGLYKAAFTAIARHHSPLLDAAEVYELHPKTQECLVQTFGAVGDPEGEKLASHVRWKRVEQGKLDENRLLRPFHEDPLLWWFLYFLIVRNLRLCDGYSQEREK